MIAISRLWRGICPVLLLLALTSCRSGSPDFPKLIDGKADVLSALAEQEAGHFVAAEKLWLAIEKQAAAAKNAKLVDQCRYWLSRLYAESGEYEKSIQFYLDYLKSKDRQRLEDNYRAVAWNEAELGNLYFKAAAWSTAVAHYELALEEWRRYGRWPAEISVLHKLALCRWRCGESADPRSAFASAEKMYDKLNSMPAMREGRWRFDVDAALMLDDYAKYLAATGFRDGSFNIAAKADNLWRQLNQYALPETAAKTPQQPLAGGNTDGIFTAENKADILRRLAERLCRSGRQVDAMQVFEARLDLLSNSALAGQATANSSGAQLVRELYSLKERCLKQNAGFKTAVSGADAKPAASSSYPPDVVENPYLAEFLSLRSQQECFDRHQELCHRYAWAVPNQEALAVLSQNQPIIEIGAGTGYWAYLLRRLGVKVAAFDLNPVPSAGNQWHRGAGRSWTAVLSGDETAVRRSSARTLFLCWPPEVNNCAYNALRLFKGDTVIYVGEGPGGCSGTAQFHNLLARDWDLVGQVEIPQWPGVYDGLFVYMRKRAGTDLPRGAMNGIAPTVRLSLQSGTSTAGSGSNEPQTSKSPAGDKIAGRENRSGLELCRQVLGREVAKAAEQSPTVVDDLSSLVASGTKVRFVDGPCRAFFDQKTRTINIASNCSVSRKLLAIAHEYGHALLNPTVLPAGGEVGKQEFVESALRDEADAIVHELVVARELRNSGIALDASTDKLLDAFDSNGRLAVETFLRVARNSANDERYETHFGRWYDEVVKPAAVRR